MDKDTLYKYFSRQLSVEERKTVQQWVDESEAHLEEFMSERALFDASLLLISESELIESENKKPSFVRRIFIKAMKVAAIVVATLCLSHLYNEYIIEKSVPMCELSVPAGQQLSLTLVDGSKVWLNSMTILRYPAMFTNDERRIELDGEGYFEVAKDEDNPFRVETFCGTIEVLGTSFNVDAYSKCNTFSTALINGKVKVSSGEQEFYLLPDQMISQNANGMLEVSQISNYDHFRWKEGIISIQNESFMQIMHKFEKFYGMKIIVERKGMEKFAYTGKFYQADGVRYALNLLQHDINFDYESDYENNIIYIK